MSDIDDIPPEFVGHFDTLGLEADTLALDPAETIVADEPPARTTVEWLEHRVASMPSAEQTDLHATEPLGEGGMGVVYEATQTSLDRRVAVKTSRSSSSDASTALLCEAVMTGQLEHPNIVPIYTLGRNDSGAPLIVMKRIEGVSWLEVIQHPDRAPDKGVDLGWHLRILAQVCNALRYAHDRGVVHRDIKPENVMIGRFGEVYLLDWGLALAVRDDPELEHFREARNAHGIAGTPHYMAPEMTKITAEEIDERTDIYLLGATLHEVVVGQPRHVGPALMDILYSAHQSEPFDYGPDLDPELAAIANRAMARDKEDRHQSVVELRDALLAYMDHAAAAQIARVASERTGALEKALESDRDELVQDLFAEARFGLTQSLQMWPDNAFARRDLQSLLERMTRYYLAAGNGGSAAALLRDLPAPNPGLEAELDELRERIALERKEVAKLERLRRAVDLSVGSPQRALFALILGFMWAGSTLWTAHIQAGIALDAPSLMVSHLESLPRVVGIAVILLLVLRKYLFANRINIRLMVVLGGLLGSIVVLRVVAWYREMSAVDAYAAEIVVYGVAAIAVGALSNLRIGLLGGPLFFATAGSVAFYPDHRLYVVAVAILVFFTGLAWIWRPTRGEPPGA